MIAKPATIERAIKQLEQRMKDVREGRDKPPEGYQAAEWLRESHRQLQVMKTRRLELPVG